MNINKFYKKIIAGFLATTIIASAFFVHSLSAQAAINKQINYQGKLTNASNVAVADGTYAIEFKLYTQLSGGVAVWTETLTGANEVQVTNGLFSVMLGSTTPFTGVDFNQTLYLGVNVESDGEMSPRKILGTVPAAFVADTLDNLSSEQFLRTDAQNATSSSSTFLNILQSGAGKVAEFFGAASQTVLALLSNGNVGVGTSTPYSKLSVAGTVVGQNFVATSTSSANVFPLLKNGEIAIVHSDGSTSYTYATTSSDVGRGTALLTAMSNATNGDHVYLSAGTFDIGSGTIDLTDGGLSSVSLHGAGKYATVITGSGSPLVKPGSYTDTTDLSLVVSGPGSFRIAWGVDNIGDSVWGARIKNVYARGYEDALYLNVNDLEDILVENVTVESSWDTFVAFTQNGVSNIDIRNSEFITLVDGNLFSPRRSINVSAADDTMSLNIYDSKISSDQNAIYADDRVDVKIYNGVITGTLADVGTGTTISVSPGTMFDPTNTSGTIAYLAPSVVAANLANYNGNVGVGTTSPYSKLSVAGTVVGQNFVATSTTASTFPYASTTALSVSGLTSGRVSFIGTGGLLRDSANLTFTDGNVLRVQSAGVSLDSNRRFTFDADVDGFSSIYYDATNAAGFGFTTANIYAANSAGGAKHVFIDGEDSGALASILLPNSGSSLGVGTSSPAAAVGINGGWFTTASSTGMNGINLTAGCFAIGGSCLTSYSNTLVNAFIHASTTIPKTYTANAFTAVNTFSSNVGIGATSPAAKLHIMGFTPELRIEGGTDDQTKISFYDDNSEVAFIRNDQSDSSLHLSASGPNNNMKFFVGGAAVPQFIIDNNSNIGIGTTSPYSKLSVAGTVVGQNFVATSTTATSTLPNLAVSNRFLLAPVILVKPDGTQIPYGQGAASDSIRGAALEAAVSASTAGDKILLMGSVYTLSNPITLASSTALVGVGNPTIQSSFTGNPTIIIKNSTTTVSDLKIITADTGIGKHGSGGISVTGIEIARVNIQPGNSSACAMAWNNSCVGGVVEHYIQGTIRDSILVGGDSSGTFGILAPLQSGSHLKLINNEVFGWTDGVLFQGSSGATVEIFGGTYTSEIDPITSGGATIYVNGAKARGVVANADLFEDGGNIIAVNVDYTTASVGVQGDHRMPQDLTVGSQILVGEPEGVPSAFTLESVGTFGVSTSGYSNNGNKFIVDSSGNVGIGTTSPYAKLSVVGQIVGEYFTATSTTATSTFNGNAQVKGVLQVGTSSIYLRSAATSTFDGGVNISAGCFAVNGTCLTNSVYGDTTVNAFIHASTTIPKTYTANTFTALQTFTGGMTVGNGTTGTITLGDGTITKSSFDYFTLNSGLRVDNGGIALGGSAPLLDNAITNDTDIIIQPNSGSSLFVDTVSDVVLGDYNILNNGAYLTLDTDNNIAAFANLNIGAGTFNPTRNISINATDGYLSFNNSDVERWVVGNEGTFSDRFVVYNAVGSAYAMAIDPTTSNIGFGTTTPGTKLSIGNTGASTINISPTATSTFGYGINLRAGCFAVNNSCMTIGFGTAGQVPYYSGTGSTLTATSSLFIASTGNVGIGTTSPVSKLDVYGNIRLTGGSRTIDTESYTTLGGTAGGSLTLTAGNGTTASPGSVVVSAGSGSTGGSVSITGGAAAGIGGGVSITTGGGPTAGNILLSPSGSGNIFLSAGGSGNININPNSGNIIIATSSSAKIGVGTTSPYAKLSVAGQIVGEYFTGTSTATSTFGGNLVINGTGTTTSAGGFNLSAGCFAVAGTCLTSYSNTLVNAYIHASTTIPKTYTTNTFTALNTFNSGILSLASSTIGNGTAQGGLTINGTASTTNLFVLDDISMPDSAIYFSSSALGNSIYGNNDAIAIRTNGANRIEANYGGPILFFDESSNVRASILTNGNFGIGVETPGSRIQAVDGTVAELKFNSGAATLTPTLALGNTDVNGKFGALIAGTSGSGFYFDNTGFFDIVAASKSDYTGNTLGASGTTLMKILNTGEVGIGNSSPAVALHIGGENGLNGSIRLTEVVNTNYSNIYTYPDDGFMMIEPGQGLLGIGTGFSPGSRLSVNANAAIGSTFATLSAPTDGLIVQGNVGIGTSSPYAKLSVTGTVVGQNFVATSTTATSTFTSMTAGGTTGMFVSSSGTGKVAFGENAFDSASALTVNNAFVVQYGLNGSDWFSVAGGNVLFNGAGGTTRAGGVDLGARFNIAAISDAMPTLAVRGHTGATSDIIRVSSPTQTTGDLFIVKGTANGGYVGIGTTSPIARLSISQNPSSNATLMSIDNASNKELFSVKNTRNATYISAQSAGHAADYSGIMVTPDPAYSAGTATYVLASTVGGGGRIYFAGVNSATGATTTLYSMNFTNVSNWESVPAVIGQQTSTNAGGFCPGVTCSAVGHNSGGDLVLLYGADAASYITNIQGGGGNPNLAFKTYLSNSSTYRSFHPYGFEFNTATSAANMSTVTHSTWRTANTDIMTLTPTGKLNIGSTTAATSTMASLSVTGIAGTDLFSVASSTNAEVFTVNKFANVGVGTSSPIGKFEVVLNNTDYTNTNGANSHIVMNNPNASGQNVMSSIINGQVRAKWRTDITGNVSWVAGGSGAHYFYTGGDYGVGTAQMIVYADGTIQTAAGNTLDDGFGYITAVNDVCEGATGHCLSELSDRRLKTDIQPLGSTLDRVLQLNPVTYKWNDLYLNNRPGLRNATSTKIGFIAQEVQELFPDIITGDIDGNGGYIGVDYSKFSAVLAEAIKETNVKIDLVASSTAPTDCPDGECLVPTINDLKAKYSELAEKAAEHLSMIEAQQEEIEALKAVASSTQSVATTTTSGEFVVASSTLEMIASTTADTLASSTPSFIARVASAVQQTITSAGEWVLSKITAQVALFDRVETKIAAVSRGLEMKDQATGQIYCVSIKNGEWDKSQGTCSDIVEVEDNNQDDNSNDNTGTLTSTGNTNDGGQATTTETIADSDSGDTTDNTTASSTPEVTPPASATESETTDSGTNEEGGSDVVVSETPDSAPADSPADESVEAPAETPAEGDVAPAP